jgi:hypothetical protein
MRGISWTAEDLSAFQEWPCSMERELERQILLWMLIVNLYGILYVLYVGQPLVIVPSHDMWDYRTSFYLIPVLSWHIKVLLTDHKGRHLTNHTTCWTLQGELQNKLRFRYPAFLLNGVFAVVRVSVGTVADNNDSCHCSDIFNVMAHRHVFNEL